MSINAATNARRVLTNLADPKVIQYADIAVATGTHEWIWDPEVSGVAGLVRKGTKKAAIIVYVDDNDFERDGELEDEL